jgi:hypothetical protein
MTSLNGRSEVVFVKDNNANEMCTLVVILIFTRLLAQFKTDANISSALAHEACFIELLSLHVCTNSQSIV